MHITYEILQKPIEKTCQITTNLNDFFMGHAEIWFLFTSANDDFTIFLKMYGNLSMTIPYTKGPILYLVFSS